MSETTKSYFHLSSTESLLFKIHSAYWGALPSSTSSFSLSSLPLILPLLLPKEWDLLLPILMQVEDKGEALHRLTDCLLAIITQLPTSQRRSLLLSYSTILAKEGGEESVEELCTLINVLNENEDEASLLWTALHSLLTEENEETDDMLAWLQASSRFETLPFCSFVKTSILNSSTKSYYRCEGGDTAVRILLQRKDD